MTVADAIRLSAEPTGHTAAVWMTETVRLLQGDSVKKSGAIGRALIDSLAALVVGRETDFLEQERELGLPLGSPP